MQLIGLVGPSVFLLLLGYTPINTTLAVIYLTAALSLNAFTCAGVSVYHQFLVPRLSGLVFSIGNTCSIIPGVIGIVVAGSILDATQSWSLIFLLGIMCFVAGTVVWVCLAHGRPENLDAWTLEESRLTPHQGAI
jgi:MFS family permease